ncbi:porin [Erwinia sp. V71]|uniref:porin n=1 Tax=Erwinia sp. V71 TaxID=3369424 RepID=UPI003F61E6AB
MMNICSNKLYALGVLALFYTGVANAAMIYDKDGNKVDFYGKLVAKGKYSFSGGHTHKDSGFGSIGFRGQTKINDELTGYGQWEYRAYTNSYEGNESTETRVAFSGLQYGKLGKVRFNHSKFCS